MVEQGHTPILFIGWDMARTDYHHRIAGYTGTLQAASLEPHKLLLIEFSKWQPLIVPEVERVKPTAIICVHDPLALEMRDVLLEAGYGIPTDISLVGMDTCHRPSQSV